MNTIDKLGKFLRNDFFVDKATTKELLRTVWPQSDPGHQYRLSDQERTSRQDVTEQYAGHREKVPLNSIYCFSLYFHPVKALPDTAEANFGYSFES